MARVAFYQAAILDTRPGAELRTALEEAKKSNANIILGDRVGDSIPPIFPSIYPIPSSATPSLLS